MFQTYLLIGSTPEKRHNEAIKLRDSRKGAAVDTVIMPSDGETSIKIEHVRQVQQTMSRHPMMSPITTAIFLEMERASTETQHALLKLLEEPPSFALIILTAPKKEALLPTILSRASIIRLHQSAEPFDFEKTYKELHTLLESDAGLKFSQSANFETKEQAVFWLQTVLHSLHQKLLLDHFEQKTINLHYRAGIRKITRALNTLKTTNTSPRLLMENLLLDLSNVPSLDPTHK